MKNTHVTLVVDPEFGEQAEAKSRLGPLWVVQSPTNIAAMLKIREAKEKPSDDLTLFNNAAEKSPEELAAHFIGTLDEHHPKWQEFEVVGAQPSAQLLGVFKEYGAGSVKQTSKGFIFSRQTF